jgi:hypothetical protein
MMEFLISTEEIRRVFKLSFRKPRVLGRRIADPRYEVLVITSDFLVGKDCFYFKFFFLIDDVRRWFFEIRAVDDCLMIGG